VPDEGGSMADARPQRPGEERGRAGVQQHTADKVQDAPMPEYEIDERRDESASVIERAGGEGADDGTDQVFEPDDGRA
jgi:hypothetical protein